MLTRMRVTVRPTGDRAGELRTAADVRRDLWAHSPVEVSPDHPLHGTHRDQERRAYFEFVTERPDEVRRVVDEYGYTDRVDLSAYAEQPGEECVNCGNVAGSVLPTVCPNCAFRDVSACPSCDREVPRQEYVRLTDGLHQCPCCRNRVHLRFNSPMFAEDGTYHQPLVVVEQAGVVHGV